MNHNRSSHMGLALLAALSAVACAAGTPEVPDRDVPDGVWVRSGCRLAVAESTIRRPRFMAFDNEGTLYVSLPGEGVVKSCRDADGDGYFESLQTFVEDHRTVHGLFWREGWLWFTESGAIFRARDTDGDGRADETVTVVPKGRLPSGGGHWWRPILIHKGRLYTGIGDSGNIRDLRDTPRQKIWSYALDGGDERQFCSGIRNTEKLVVRPGTDEIWGMDHGSDWFGRPIERKDDRVDQEITDLNPPDEMNRYVEGGWYGHPFVVGSRLPRYEFLDHPEIARLAATTIPPEWPTGAHWAPNAMTFYTGARFPGARGDAFVAYHGSWNRSHKAGYCVTRVFFEDGRPWGEKVYAKFLTGDDEVLGRPVDVVQAPDGSLLVSDDRGNRIYRLDYVGEE